MLDSYYQNAKVGMTKERYFEVCEAMGNEPLESEIPVEYYDLPLEVQEAIAIYNNLQDSWDYMGGNYIGKNLAGFGDIMEIFEIPKEDRRDLYELIMLIDRMRAKQIADEKDKKPSN